MKAPGQTTGGSNVPRPQPEPQVHVRNEFTIEEHLRVQRQIEQRAYRMWCAQGNAPDSALNNWLKAEREVLAAFVATRAAVAGETHTRTGGPASFRAPVWQPCWPMPKLKLIPTLQCQL
jgi:hypothetical protein